MPTLYVRLVVEPQIKDRQLQPLQNPSTAALTSSKSMSPPPNRSMTGRKFSVRNFSDCVVYICALVSPVSRGWSSGSSLTLRRRCNFIDKSADIPMIPSHLGDDRRLRHVIVLHLAIKIKFKKYGGPTTVLHRGAHHDKSGPAQPKPNLNMYLNLTGSLKYYQKYS